MFYLLRTSNPASESWVFLVYAIMLAMLFVSVQLSPGLVSVSFSSLFSNKERDSIFFNGLSDLRSSLLSTLYCVGIISLNIYLGMYQGGVFPISNLLLISLMLVAVMVVKYAIVWLLCYVFLDSGTYDVIVQQYQRLTIATSVILTPLTILAIYLIQIYPTAIYIAYIAVAIFWLIVLLVKFFQLFYTKIISTFYIFLYLCTMEILPMAILLYGTKMIIS